MPHPRCKLPTWQHLHQSQLWSTTACPACWSQTASYQRTWPQACPPGPPLGVCVGCPDSEEGREQSYLSVQKEITELVHLWEPTALLALTPAAPHTPQDVNCLHPSPLPVSWGQHTFRAMDVARATKRYIPCCNKHKYNRCVVTRSTYNQ